MRFDDRPVARPGAAAEIDEQAAPATAVRLFLVSSTRLVREGLVHALGRRRCIALVGCDDSAAATPHRIARADPDVVAIDLADPGGLDAARLVRGGLAPRTKLVAFSVADTPDAVLACAAAGFSGYVTRDGTIDDLLRAVRDAQAGRLTCTPHMTAALFDHLAHLLRRPETGAGTLLTPREEEILALVETGCSNKEIARTLGISPATVKNHIHNILAKLKVDRRTKAAAASRP